MLYSMLDSVFSCKISRVFCFVNTCKHYFYSTFISNSIIIGIDISCITNSRDLKCYALECHGLFDFLSYVLCRCRCNCIEKSGPDHSCGGEGVLTQNSIKILAAKQQQLCSWTWLCVRGKMQLDGLQTSLKIFSKLNDGTWMQNRFLFCWK